VRPWLVPRWNPESRSLTADADLGIGGVSGRAVLAVPGLAVPGLAVPGLAVPGLAVPGLAVPGLAVPEPIVPEPIVPGTRLARGDRTGRPAAVVPLEAGLTAARAASQPGSAGEAQPTASVAAEPPACLRRLPNQSDSTAS
jgi:hypothetical protein